jgi:hypothetical protein
VDAAITAALADLIGDVTGHITTIAPVALGVAGLLVGWKYVRKLVRSI